MENNPETSDLTTEALTRPYYKQTNPTDPIPLNLLHRCIVLYPALGSAPVVGAAHARETPQFGASP